MMSGKAYQEIGMLKAGQSKRFHFSLCPDADIVRTGVIGDGSCLVHCLLRAHSREYAAANIPSKCAMAAEIRSRLASKISVNVWKNIHGGTVAFVSWQEKLLYFTKKMYEFIENGNKENLNEFVKNMISDVVSRDGQRESLRQVFKVFSIKFLTGDNGVFDQVAYKHCSSIDEATDLILEVTEKRISDILEANEIKKEKINKIIIKYVSMLKTIMNTTEEYCFSEFVHLMRSVSHLDQSQLGLLGNMFGYDIFIIDAKNRLPYFGGEGEGESFLCKKRKTVFILWVNDCHYEILGRIIPDTNQVQRVFEVDDDIVEIVRCYVTEPELFGSKYSHLLQYLPASIRRQHASSTRQKNIQSDGIPLVDSDVEQSDLESDASRSESDE